MCSDEISLTSSGKGYEWLTVFKVSYFTQQAMLQKDMSPYRTLHKPNFMRTEAVQKLPLFTLNRARSYARIYMYI